MNPKRSKRSTKTVSVCMLFLLMLTFIPVISEAITCEEALWNCLNDPINGVLIGGAVYCFNGYVFCKKYIEKDTAK